MAVVIVSTVFHLSNFTIFVHKHSLAQQNTHFTKVLKEENYCDRLY